MFVDDNVLSVDKGFCESPPDASIGGGKVEKSGNGGGNGKPPGAGVSGSDSGSDSGTATTGSAEPNGADLVGPSEKISTILLSSLSVALFIGAVADVSEPLR